MPLRTDAEILAAIDSEEALALDSQSGELQGQRSDALARYRGDSLPGDSELVAMGGRSMVIDKSVLDTIEWIMPSLVRIYLGGDEIGEFDAFGPEDEPAAKAETEACNWYLTAKNDTFSHINSTLRDALLLKNGYMVGMWKTDQTVVTETYIGKTDEEVAFLMEDKCIKIVEHSEYPDPYAPDPQMAPMGQPPPQGASPAPMAGPPGPPAMSMPGLVGASPGQGMAGAGGSTPPLAPTMLHDVKIERVRPDEYVAIESVPPEEIIVARRHRWTSLMDCDFVQWRRRTTVGQLRAEGFTIPDDVPSYTDFSQEGVIRARFHENDRYDDQTTDPSRKVVMFKDTYMQLDIRGKGMPQLWRICHIADDDKILLKEEADLIPFAAFSPIIYPHSHIGSSVYDLIQDLSLIKTALQRQFLDGVYQQHSNQKVVNMNAGVNLDDLMVSRPGNIIRCEGDPSQAVVPLQITDITPSILTGLQYIDTVRRDRVGVDYSTAPLDPNAIKQPITATHDLMVASGAQAKIELIARTLAGGFRDLMRIIHALASKHSTKSLQMKLHGKWTAVNPREWTTRTDFTINIGLGTGAPEVQMQKLQMMAPMMQQWMAMGLAGPQEVYNLSVEFIKIAGWRIPDKFIHPPEIGSDGKPVMPPPQPDPSVQVAQIKAQADQQNAQVKAQFDQQTEQARLQVQQQIEAAQAQADVAVQQHKMEASNQLEMAKARMQLEVDAAKHDREQHTQIMIANIKAANALEIARVNQQIEDGKAVLQRELKDAGQGDAAAMLDAITQMHADVKAASGPKEFIRGADGKVSGVKGANGAVQKVARGPDGRATGLQ